MKIAAHCMVSIHYTLTDQGGSVLDTSNGKAALTYLHGSGTVIAGLETHLQGLQPGDRVSAVIQPADGYGELDPSLIEKVARSDLAAVDDLRVGLQLRTKAHDGRLQNYRIEAISDDQVTLNGNHVLAGKVLHFEVSIEAVRAATPEEIQASKP